MGNESVAKYNKQSRMRAIKQWAGFSLIAATLAFVLVGWNIPIETKTVVGNVTGFHSKASREGDHLMLSVKLKNGRYVNASIYSFIGIKIGDEVEVSESKTILFSYKFYRFLRKV